MMRSCHLEAYARNGGANATEGVEDADVHLPNAAVAWSHHQLQGGWIRDRRRGTA